MWSVWGDVCVCDMFVAEIFDIGEEGCYWLCTVGRVC